MKTYVGLMINGVSDVYVHRTGEADDAVTPLVGDFAWGAMPRTDPAWATHNKKTFDLSLAILTDLLGPHRAEKLARRFMWRSPAAWTLNADWTMTDQAVMGIVNAIEGTEAETAQTRVMAAQAIAPVVHEGGGGPGGAPVVWDNTEAVGIQSPIKKP